VTGDREPAVAERRHHLDLVQRQRAFRIVDEIVAGRRLRAVAIAAQIGHDDGEILRQARRHLAPPHMGLGIAVEQQQRRPAAAGTLSILPFLGFPFDVKSSIARS
jgi:hypothetical protein